MAQSYTVQKGDTLSGIAKKYGVGISDISGYRSGNPDLIYAGETLNVGAPSGTKADSYASEMKSQLEGQYGSTPQSSSTPTSTTKPTSIYDLDSLRTETSDYKTKLDSAFQKLQSVQQDTFQSEYDKRALADKKAKMADLDSKIAAERQKRDDAIAKVRGNPGLSAAQMTGDIKKLADYQNSVINNLIDERNGVASEYNSDLDEIDKLVSRASSGAAAEYKYYSDLLGNTTSKIGDYSKALSDELKMGQDESQFERQLANALEIAQLRASNSGGSNLHLARNPITGKADYWYDDEGNIYPVEDTGGSGGGDPTLDDLESTLAGQQGAGQSGEKTGTWWNPFSWANYF